jgi:DnaJ-class molecular chaperone
MCIDIIGKGVDFYNHLGISSSATLGELNKAYRKKSLELQYVQLPLPIRIKYGKLMTSPDKNPGVKDIQARFARLGVITQILRSPESRERYNVDPSPIMIMSSLTSSSSTRMECQSGEEQGTTTLDTDLLFYTLLHS